MLTRSLSTRERDARAIEALPKVEPIAPLALVPQVKADPLVVQVPRRPRIAFMEVVRDQFGEIAGLRPIYEE